MSKQHPQHDQERSDQMKKVILGSSLQEFTDDLAKSLYNMTKIEAIKYGICINCKEPMVFNHGHGHGAPVPGKQGDIYSSAGFSEYMISGYCEYCFDELFNDEEEVSND